ncbi:histidine kinase [Flavobacterium nitratireducens]|uniref:histidine kinase n=1 Tax=Flavobacterium nitratireducens TaxID=992289 RepID=UPI0024152054|nr:histidine kinase [Flavobacterium nitratireducens]
MNVQKELVKSVGIGLIVFVVIQIINYSASLQLPTLESLQWNLFYTLLYTVVLYFTNAYVFALVYKKNKITALSFNRILIGFGLSFGLSMITIFVLRFLEEVIIDKTPVADFLNGEKPSYYIVALIITVIVSLVIHLLYFYKNYQENRVKQEKIIAGTASAQFESLKNQLDPHFLFNSLNVLSSLIEENPDSAQKFTTSLSKVYRYVLEQRDKELVTVEEELAFAKTYMNLLKMRFENSISFELPEVVTIPEAKVVPLSLQLLLENCIKHNTVSEPKPLHIKIYIEKNELIIENNKQKKEVLQDRKGVGLQNIISRYAILTDRKVSIEESDAIFKVNLPILTKQITITMNATATYNEDLAYVKAKERVQKIRNFYKSLFVYVIVISFLAVSSYPHYSNNWFWIVLAAWGMSIALKAVNVFGFGKDWEERKIEELINNDKSNKKYYN